MTYQVFKPSITDVEKQAVMEVLDSGWLGLGPKTAQFEKEFAAYLGVNNCVALNSCTAALDMALRVFGIGQHDKVLVPTMTFVSTAHAVLYNNAMPVFVDCDDSLQFDIEDMANKVDAQTKAVVVVHYGGAVNSNIDYIRNFCDARDLILIEDCAHAAGASLEGRKAGTFGDAACFSFHAVKNLAAGDGGALVVDSQRATRAKKLRWLGIDKGTWDRTANNREYWWEYKVDEIGYKNHPCDILMSIALGQLTRLDDMNAKRRMLKKEYEEQLKDVDHIDIIKTDEESACHLIVAVADKRDLLADYLKRCNVSTGVHYKPIHLYDCYGNTPVLPNAEKMFKKILTLPTYYDLEKKDVSVICSYIKDFYKG